MLALGWRDILRPIRDGLRDRLPHPKPDGDIEKGRQQQRADALRGFTYFEDFEQLLDWRAQDVDPIQRANTPLLPRVVRPLEERGEEARANVLLCHDYSGNYHPYESVQGLGVDAESYACEYLQFIETFIYFSHKRVSVPPPTWINTLHRNGVKVLGTVLVEPGSVDVEQILKKEERPSSQGKDIYVVAKHLAAVAKCYAFDGWLINIEKAIPSRSWDLQDLLCFLGQLKAELGPSGKVIWLVNTFNYVRQAWRQIYWTPSSLNGYGRGSSKIFSWVRFDNSFTLIYGARNSLFPYLVIDWILHWGCCPHTLFQ